MRDAAQDQVASGVRATSGQGTEDEQEAPALNQHHQGQDRGGAELPGWRQRSGPGSTAPGRSQLVRLRCSDPLGAQALSLKLINHLPADSGYVASAARGNATRMPASGQAGAAARARTAAAIPSGW